MSSLPVSVQTIGLLVASNVFLSLAWYGHLKNLNTHTWYVAALVSWGIGLRPPPRMAKAVPGLARAAAAPPGPS